MFKKLFGFIGKWLGYLILGLIAIAIIKFFVLPPENPNTLGYLWGKKMQRYWNGLDKEYSKNPPFYSPQESIKCCSLELTKLEPMEYEYSGYCPKIGTRDSMIQIYNEFLITEALKGRVLLIGGRGESQRLESINSMSCEHKHSLYFNNYVEFRGEKIKKLLNTLE